MKLRLQTLCGFGYIHHKTFMKKIYSFNSELYKVTGVQKVMMDVHHAVSEEYDAKIVGTIPYKDVHIDHGINEHEYVRLRNPFMFRNSIVIAHERKFLVFFWLLNKVFRQNIKLVYIHHNVFHNHQLLSIMPKNVVAISDEGVRNLHDFFGVSMGHIHKIYNSVKDVHPKSHKPYDGGEVKILYPARINRQKRQLEIVERLKGRLDAKVKIIFAGIGPDYEELKSKVEGLQNFQCLGYRSDIYQLQQDCNYMMLFSGHEGLPITLIEAMMMGTPAICSNVGGNAEIVKDGTNGFVIDKEDWEGLAKTINALGDVEEKEYEGLSLQARLQYECHFTFERFKENYLELLHSL